MSDIIDINVAQTVEEVTINVTEEVIQVNINTINGGGGIESVVAGTNITVDNTDPDNPIVSATGLVPYNGATSDVNLGEFGLLTGNLEFDNTPTNLPTNSGSVYYNDTDGTLDLILKGGNVKLQIGQEQVVRVVNKTATNINLLQSNYQAVRVTGAQGQRMKVDLAQATNDLLSAETIGLVTETINNNQEGFITTSGLVRNINTTGSLQSETETWADGDILYLSPTVAGSLTNVKPVAPNHLVIIGYVIYAHATQGSIFVKVDNGYELDELHNVKIDTPLNNQGLVYNSTLEVWENKAINLQRVLEAGGTSNNGEILLSYTGSDYRMFINGDQLLSYDITTNESISIIPPFITVNGTSNNLLIKPSKFEFLQGAFKTEITRVTPTANRVITFKDESGTVALTSDIPSPITIDATPTDGSINAVSSNGVFDALALKQDSLPNLLGLDMPSGYITTLNNYSGINYTPFSSNAANSNNVCFFQFFYIDRPTTIDEFYLQHGAENNGASANVTLYIFDDSNSGFPGIKVHQEITSNGILTGASKNIIFTNNITLPIGGYWLGIHLRDLNTSGTNPTFGFSTVVGLQRSYQSTISYTNNYYNILRISTASTLVDNPTVGFSQIGTPNFPMIKIKI